MSVVEVASPGVARAGLRVTSGHPGSALGSDMAEQPCPGPTCGCPINPRPVAVVRPPAPTLGFASDPNSLVGADVLVVDLPFQAHQATAFGASPLANACHLIGRHMRPGVTVVFQIAAFPGATEEICIPALAQASGLRHLHDFFVGFVSAQDGPPTQARLLAADSAQTVDLLTALFGTASGQGLHPVSSIRVAEAAASLVLAQDQLNVALMNELACIFDRLCLDTGQVLEAAGTKWNFLPFRPGLVGRSGALAEGQWLSQRAQRAGVLPELLLAGQRKHEGMAAFIAGTTVRQLISAGINVGTARVNLLAPANVQHSAEPRHSQIAALITELQGYGLQVNVHDPLVSAGAAQGERGAAAAYMREMHDLQPADALVVVVADPAWNGMNAAQACGLLLAGGVVIDIPSCLDQLNLSQAGYRVWRL